MLPDINTLLEPRPRKYRNLVKHLSGPLLTTDFSMDRLTDRDIFDDLTTSRGSCRFLGIFSPKGIEFTLRQFGVTDHLKKVGLPPPKILCDTREPFKHMVRMVHNLEEKEVISGEAVMRRGSFNISFDSDQNSHKKEFIIVEWFLLQHPTKPFSRRRPQLPGQEQPGLGLSELIFEMFYWLGRRLAVDGIIIIPNYLHTGLFYGRQFIFIDPVRQGENYVLAKLIPKKYRLDQLTWACAEGQLVNSRTKDLYLWKPAPMVLPVSHAVKDHFHTREYVTQVRDTRNNFRVHINHGYQKHYRSDWTAD